jgi:acyl carrier protein
VTTSDVNARIRGFLQPHLGENQVADTDDIFALGLVSSLFAMQLAIFVEREFGFRLGPDDMDFNHFRSIAGLTNFVESKLTALSR